jgi:hypothetical protein
MSLILPLNLGGKKASEKSSTTPSLNILNKNEH